MDTKSKHKLNEEITDFYTALQHLTHRSTGAFIPLSHWDAPRLTLQTVLVDTHYK